MTAEKSIKPSKGIDATTYSVFFTVILNKACLTFYAAYVKGGQPRLVGD